ncbi:MAG: type II toxin-antitoxin system VapB family antitoxin [Methylibium sp.]|uniref:type II toxin-antitoxin system VapB family antitoxin n=1 Tax=Methylibium sp. TaxID=2067992 RepID=UPI0017D9E12E|nr:type II toxin-antitoxin system VapB family antitoxin [Methylibium sp.]MBA2723126.1 type II toxin-antitoxin system VapB family antitoxin [Methylibium sp.]MBA3591138.1 type II toxin-antitoxin system VapB family antitoxin [Methylibium sp.]
MRTNIDLDEALIAEAQRLAGLRSKRETVDAALREFVSRRRQQDILALAGKSLIARDYDVRAVRARMNKR